MSGPSSPPPPPPASGGAAKPKASGKPNLGKLALPTRPPRQTQFLRAIKDNRLRSLTKHLLDIHDPLDAQNDPAKKREEEEFLKLDPFNQRKRLIANKLQEIREDLKKKLELQREDPRSGDKVRITQKIHKDFKEVTDMMTECKNMIDRDEAKLRKKPNEEAARELSLKKAAFEIMQRHVKEVEELKKPTTAHRPANMPASGGFASVEALKDPTKTSLPEIDLTEFHQEVATRDKRIDAGLQELSGRVAELRVAAGSLGQQLDTQNRTLQKLEDKTDHLNEELYGINKKLKETLSKVRGPSRFCLDVCCCCIILALAGFIYNMVKG